MKKYQESIKLSGNSNGYFFVLPAFIFMLIFIGIPVICNFVLSFQDVDVMSLNSPEKVFVGIRNYSALLDDPVFLAAIKNTLFFSAGSIFFQFIIGFALALLFNQKFPLAKPIKGLSIITWMIPLTITALIFKLMFSVNGGIFNHLLMTAGIIQRPIEWLLHPFSAMWSIVITNIWVGIPFNMVLISTGLTTIPEHLYEASKIDGANIFQRFIYITVPLLSPAIKSVLVLGFIYTFKVFDIVYIMTQGGPAGATEMLSTYSYKLSFVQFNFSEGAAVANILFAILLFVGLFYIRLVGEDEVI